MEDETWNGITESVCTKYICSLNPPSTLELFKFCTKEKIRINSHFSLFLNLIFHVVGILYTFSFAVRYVINPLS